MMKLNHKKRIGRRTNRRRAGLSLIEVLISLVITALLLTATAAAFDAALNSYKDNHDISMVNVAARNSLYQMCSTIRSAWNDPDYDTIDINVEGTQCSLVDADGRDIIYRYDGDSKQLQMNVNGSGDWYVLVDNVEPITVGDVIFSSTEAGGDFAVGTVGQVETRFRIEHGNVSKSISAAAVPRNVVYAN